MGDPSRFRLLAELVESLHPDRQLEIADVAAGKGHLKAALYLRGYRRVTAWDQRRRFAKRRPGQKYALFDHRNAPRGYHLVLGMHPDEATDQIILYAAKHRVPFLVCPCCIKPSGVPYEGPKDKPHWLAHLRELARAGRMVVEDASLPMAGDNLVLIGRPE